MVDRIKTAPWLSTSSSQNLWGCSLEWQKGALQMWLGSGPWVGETTLYYAVDPAPSQDTYKRDMGCQSRERVDGTVQLALKTEEGTLGQGMQAARSWKRQGMDSPLRSLEGPQPSDTLNFSTSNLQDYETVNFGCFKPQSLAVYSNNSKYDTICWVVRILSNLHSFIKKKNSLLSKHDVPGIVPTSEGTAVAQTVRN